MATKKIKAKLKEICVVCGNQISFSKERYVKLTDYNGKRKESQCFYHLQCWKDQFKIQQKKNFEEFMSPYVSQLNQIMKKGGLLQNV